MKNNRYIWLFVVAALALALFPDTAFATTTGVHTITGAFKSAASGWYTEVKTVATDIFAVLFGVELTWMAVQWMITGKDVHEIFTSFIKKLITIGFFYLILLNGHMLSWDVIQAFQATGVAAAGAPHTGMGWLLDTGLKIFDACLHGPKSSSGTTDWLGLPSAKATIAAVVGALVGIIVGIIAILALIYMALEYLAVQIEAILVTSLGVILLGFGGSKFTASYVEGYIKYALSVGIRFFVLVVWVAFIENQAPTIITNLVAGVEHSDGGTIASVMAAYGDVLIFVLLIAWLTKKLPSLASSIMSGGSSLSGGELMSGAVKGVALATAAVATGGVAAAGLAAGGAAGGLGAATEAAGSAGAGSLGASAAGGASGASGVAAPAKAASGASGASSGVSAPASGGSGSGVSAPKGNTAPAPNKAPSSGSDSEANKATQGVEAGVAGAAVESAVSSSGTSSATGQSGVSSASKDGVDHRPAASNDAAPTPASSSSKGVSAPVTTDGNSAPASAPIGNGGDGDNNSGNSGNRAPAAPKPETFLEKAERHEKGMNKVMEHLSPGEAPTGGVSAPSLGVKHLSD